MAFRRVYGSTDQANTSTGSKRRFKLRFIILLAWNLTESRPDKEHELVTESSKAASDSMKSEFAGAAADVEQHAADSTVEAIGEIVNETINAIGEIVSSVTESR